MAKERVDRRVGRTRRLLKAAVLDLIREKSYEEVTIQEIVRRADVGRSTFYSHYASKEDLLFDGFDAWLLSLPDREIGSEETVRSGAHFRFSLPLLEHVRTQRKFFQATVGSGSASRVRRRTLELFTALVEKELARMVPERAGQQLDRPGEREVWVHFVVGAFLGVTSWWLDAPSKMTAAEVDGVFQHLAARGVAGLTG